MISRIRIALSFIVVLSSVRCSTETPHSSENLDIADPGSISGSNTLTWSENDQLYRAQCTPNQPTSRSNCQTNMTQQPLAAAKEQARKQGEQVKNTVQQEIQTEVTRLKEADPTVASLRSQIASLGREKAAVQSDLQQQQQAKTQKSAAKTEVDAQLTFLAEQIEKVTAALKAEPNNADLQILLHQLNAEHQTNSQTSAALAKDIAWIDQRIQWDQTQITSIDADLAELNTALANALQSAVVASPKLTELNNRLSLVTEASNALEGIFKMIATRGISYRVNLLSESQKLALSWITIAPATGTLKQGRYRLTGGYEYCPQRVSNWTRSGNVSSFKVTYLSPCSGSTNQFTCNGQSCSGTSPNATIKIVDESRYEYKNSSASVGYFAFESSDMSAPVAEGGGVDFEQE